MHQRAFTTASVILLAIGAVQGSAAAQPAASSTADWAIVESPNSPPVPTDNVLSGITCVTSSECWAVGNVTSGGTPQSLIQRWNGSSWALITSPNTGATQRNLLRDVACVSATECWAVGSFNNGDVDQPLIQHWDGASWSLVAAPTTNVSAYHFLTDIACPGANLCFASGAYLSSGGSYQTLIERWNGSAWSIVASPNTSATRSNFLNAITCASASSCVAVGSASTQTAEQSLVLAWNGTAWSIATSPNQGAGHNILYGVDCVTATDCWASGSAVVGSTQQTLMLHWNGTVWSLSLTPNASQAQNNVLLETSCSSATDCIAVGRIETGSVNRVLLLQWDGSLWASVTAPTAPGSHQLVDVSCAADACVAAGEQQAEATSRTLIARSEAGSWNVVASANGLTATHNTLLGIDCPSATSCWAVASYHNGSAQQTLIQRWNGLAWSIVGSPNTAPDQANILYDVACVSADDCWAVGYAGFTFSPLTLHWDGVVWSIVASPGLPGVNNFLNDVTCVASNDCWAVGYAGDSPTYQTLTLHWDGSAWDIVPSANDPGVMGNRLFGVTCAAAGECWAVGYRTEPNSIKHTLIERWDGSAWSIVGSPNTSDTLSNELSGVACAQPGDCWAVGTHSQGGNTGQTLILRYDGSAWSISPSANPAGSILVNLRSVSCVASDACWSVGYFFGDGHRRTLTERWDGTAWSLVASPDSSATQDNFLMNVSCVAADDCWTAGYHTDDSGVFRTMIQHLGPLPQPNHAPVAAIGAAPPTGSAPFQVTLDATASTDPDAGDSVAGYTFAFGDGSSPVTQTGATIMHTYTTPGSYTASVSVTDTHGLPSVSAATIAIEVTSAPDTTPPAPPIVGDPAPGKTVQQSFVRFSGDAEPGSTITGREGAKLIGASRADAYGDWTMAAGFTNGAHTVSFTANDDAGNQSAPAARSVTVQDTLAPAAAVIELPVDGGEVVGELVTVTGTAEPGALVELVDNGGSAGSSTVRADGRWHVLIPEAPIGAHTIHVAIMDPAGNRGPATLSRSFSVRRPSPPALRILTPQAGAVRRSEFRVTGDLAAPGARVTLLDGSSVVGTADARGDGTWSLEVRIGPGEHSLVASAPGASPSPAVGVTVDAEIPDVTVATPPRSLFMPGETGELHGTASDNRGVVSVVVTVRDASGAALVSGPAGCACGAGARLTAWSLPLDVPAGYYTASVIGFDQAGNVSMSASTRFIRL